MSETTPSRSKSAFQIVVDTREKNPWTFGDGVAVVRAALAAGDYSVVGFERSIAIERKSIDDLVRTVIHDRERFAAELSILARMRYASIVVEASFVDLVLGKFEGKSKPQSVVAAIATIATSWGVPVLFAGNRGGAATMAESLLRKASDRFAGDIFGSR